MNRSKSKKVEFAGSTSNENYEIYGKMDATTKVISVFFQLAFIAVASLIIFKTVSDAGIILFTFHPSLMAMGYLLLIMQGIIALNGRSTYTDGSKYEQKVTVHWVLQASALLMITIAQISIFVNKNINGYPHYQTIHSICGLVTYLFTVGASVFGTCTLYSNSLKSFIKPIQLKIGHALGGSVVFVLAAATICTGINQTWTEEKDAQVKLGSMVVLFLGAFYVVSRSIKTALSRIATMSKK